MMGEKIVAITVESDVAAPPVSDAFLRSEKTGVRTIEVAYDKGRVTAGQVLGLVREQGFVIEDVTTREADLEDVFVQLTSGAG
jgi:ABC-2 type transport system ATP-binding protein